MAMSTIIVTENVGRKQSWKSSLKNVEHERASLQRTQNSTLIEIYRHFYLATRPVNYPTLSPRERSIIFFPHFFAILMWKRRDFNTPPEPVCWKVIYKIFIHASESFN